MLHGAMLFLAMVVVLLLHTVTSDLHIPNLDDLKLREEEKGDAEVKNLEMLTPEANADRILDLVSLSRWHLTLIELIQYLSNSQISHHHL